MPNLLPLLTERFLNTPLLIEPGKAEVIFGVLQSRLAQVGDVSIEAANLDPEASGFVGRRVSADGRYTLARRAGNVAIVDVQGSLVNRGAWVGASSGLTSYEGIAAQIDDAAGDDDVSAIMLDINSPGGEAGGMFTLAEKIRGAAALKPVIAVVNDMAASAAYAIASAATEIVVSPTSAVGSIGVVLVHMDHSAELKAAGVSPTIIHAGAHKADGHPFGPLTDSVKAGLQARVDALYGRFLETVEAGRGKRLTAAAARRTEASVFMGEEAIEVGLADRIASFDAVLAELKSNPARATGKRSETIGMTEKSNTPSAEGMISADAHAAAVAQARTDGAAEATARIGAILGCDEAKGRESQAQHIAFKTAMSVDDAKGILALAPAAPASAAIPSIEERAKAENEFGAQKPDEKPIGASAGWGRVTERLNKSVR